MPLDNSQAKPPEGHPLSKGRPKGYTPEDTNGSFFQRWGFNYPGDLGFTAPAVECKIATGAEIRPSSEPTFDELSELNFRARLRDAEWAGATVNDDEEDEQEESQACGENTGNYCAYEVKIPYVTPQTVTTGFTDASACHAGGPCRDTPNPESSGGRPCTGTISEQCHHFPTLQGAQEFITRMQQEAARLWDNCLYKPGKRDVYAVGAVSIKVISPPPPPPPKSQFDVVYAVPIDCGEDEQAFADEELTKEESKPKPQETQ
jgi:hypothetical protein